jgi:KamA family protein
MEFEKFRPYTAKSVIETPYWAKMSYEAQEALAVVSRVLPFRTNDYVLSQLIDWSRVPDDPIFRLTFPHKDMLTEPEYETLRDLVLEKKDEVAAKKLIHGIRLRMNPHPGGQMTDNVPMLDGVALGGLQHKYKETVLFFPAAGQTCHAYCTFCFRWPQFVGMEEFKFNARESDELVAYLTRHTEVTDVLFTGGDPMIMNASSLAGYIEPILAIEHIQNIRIGTKSVAYWPQRFVTDKDADDVLRLFERVMAAGKRLSIMGHYNHPVEISTPIAQEAVRRILGTGAVLRMQSPIVRHINDDPAVWRDLWTAGVRLGAVPYYMFVERDTGPHNYFAIPLVEAYETFRTAYQQVSGLARTVRGPSMSAHPGKIVVDGVVTVGDEKLFALQFLQARRPEWVRRPFFARFDPKAVWIDDLKPAFGESRFFFEQDKPVPEYPISIISRRGNLHKSESLATEWAA